MSERELFSTGVHAGGSILFLLLAGAVGWIAFKYFAVDWKILIGALGVTLTAVGAQIARIRYTIYPDWVEANFAGQERGARIADIVSVDNHTGLLRTLLGFAVVKIGTRTGETLNITNPADANGFVSALNRAMTQVGTAAHA